MENKLKSRDVFYGIVAVATLIVAVIGATLAYFSITTNSDEGAVNVTAGVFSISYEDGNQVTFQADELIPATFEVVESAYTKAKNNANYSADAEEADRNNVCIDDNSQQVCSIYRFTVSSTVEKDIVAKLNNENNTFTYLNYAVYDVTTGDWIEFGDNDYKGISYCSNDSADENDYCYTTTEAAGIITKTYHNDVAMSAERSAVNPLFGASTADGYAKVSVGATAHTYDIVLFIKENNLNQNVDQGANYKGTITVEVVDANSGRITGKMNS